MGAEEKIQALGIALPAAPAPVGAYVPYVLSRGFLFISGQVPFRDGNLLHQGKVKDDVGVDVAQECARVCLLNALAQAKAALGSLDRVARIVRMTGYVASSEGFTDQALVLNGASELAVDIFGDAGKHARVAIGAAELPLGSPVELEVILEVTE
jgi:enamine deaminase RidA (YjgF/YER057c/UK114 family)